MLKWYSPTNDVNIQPNGNLMDIVFLQCTVLQLSLYTEPNNNKVWIDSIWALLLIPLFFSCLLVFGYSLQASNKHIFPHIGVMNLWKAVFPISYINAVNSGVTIFPEVTHPTAASREKDYLCPTSATLTRSFSTKIMC